jgi:uroporphyrinogen-III synthase
MLLPRAGAARDVAPLELARRGAEVDAVEAYRTVPPEDAARRAQEIFSALRKPDFITFTSSSTVRHLVEAAGAEAFQGVKAVSIGPVTTRTARACGVEVAAEARESTTEGLVEAVVRLCETEMNSAPRE